MYIALGCMFLGIVLGRLLRGRVRISLSPVILSVICLLLFVLGVELGLNDELISKFARIGVSSIAVALFAVAGSCLAAGVFYRYFVKNDFKRK